MTTNIKFVSYAEDLPGPRWKEKFDCFWPGYRAWYLRSSLALRPSYVECRRALRKFMPELLPIWQALIELSGGSDIEARFLSMWCPPAYIMGCSQTVWIDPANREEPVLLRNYDFAPALLEGAWTATRWLGQRTICMSDCLWGALDGLNEAGLAASLSFGGRKAYGPGFGVPLMLRYILETAETVRDAARILSALPSSMSYNIALLDKGGDWATVFVAPDRPAEVVREKTTTNLQHRVEWEAHAKATRAVERLNHLNKIAASAVRSNIVIKSLLTPPLFQTRYGNGYGTLYTAIYRPQSAAAALVWPKESWQQLLPTFNDGEREITYAAE